ncbi:MAG TPA: hypothetical protein VKI20_07145 [Acidimicrobiales bacterium]|nr:hypothetical protein [Acidimicrobiales bacterium]
MVVEFDRAIKACPDLATFASQIKGRDTTNTGVGLNMSCTSDVAPPAPGADLPTPDEAVLTSQVCSDYRTECVDLKTMADLTEAGNEGKYSYQVPGLDARADANTAKMKACESKYFGYSG